MDVRSTPETATTLDDRAASSGRVPEEIADDVLADQDSLESTAASVAEAFRSTLDLFQTGVDLMRQNLRRRYPEASAEDIDRLLRAWLLERPGAEAGDASGRAVDVNSRLA